LGRHHKKHESPKIRPQHFIHGFRPGHDALAHVNLPQSEPLAYHAQVIGKLAFGIHGCILAPI
jgi:hypothetical protein